MLFNELFDSGFLNLSGCYINILLLLFFRDTSSMQVAILLLTMANFLNEDLFYYFFIYRF